MTTLKNDSWPMIKYKLGDIGEISYENSIAYINIRQGRKADFFTLNNNRLFNAILFSGLARGVCELFGDMAIMQFQIIKKSEEELDLKIKLANSPNKMKVFDYFKSEIVCEFSKYLEKYANNLYSNPGITIKVIEGDNIIRIYYERHICSHRKVEVIENHTISRSFVRRAGGPLGSVCWWLAVACIAG